MKFPKKPKPGSQPNDFVQPMGCTTCNHFACVCNIRENHRDDCTFRIAASSAVGIECEHGRDVCPTCDPCTCG